MAVDSREDTRSSPLERLVSPYGVIHSVAPRPPMRGMPQLKRAAVDLGNGWGRPGHTDNRLTAGGKAIGDEALARTIAIAEGAERYSGGPFFPEEPILARASDLPGRVLNLASVPRCSAQEQESADCPFTAPDEMAKIRWVRGTDIRDGQPTWTPAIMASWGLPPYESERFWYRISTGYAVHTDPARALLSGMAEVIEREMIAVLWMQQLPLPHIPYEQLPEAAQDIVTACDRQFVKTYFLDATSDTGLPCVYCVQRAPFDEKAYSLVGCGTGLTIGNAALKSLTEAVGMRRLIHAEDAPPIELRDFRSISDGARYMGIPERGDAFSFLIDDMLPRQPFSDPGPFAEDALAATKRLTRWFAEKEMPAIAVHRTTTELASVGLLALTMVIPGLLPMSLRPLGMFKAHPRLYEVPASLGYRVRPESELNSFPQPFA